MLFFGKNEKKVSTRIVFETQGVKIVCIYLCRDRRDLYNQLPFPANVGIKNKYDIKFFSKTLKEI